MPWKLIDVEEDRLLVIVALEGGCAPFNHLEVDESKEGKVLVTALAKITTPSPNADPEKPRGCAGYIGYKYPTYELKSPLGSRELVHAPISPEWDGPKTIDPAWKKNPESK